MKQFLVKLNNNSRNSIALSGPGSTRGGVEDFISGGLAGMFSKTMVMPFDVIR